MSKAKNVKVASAGQKGKAKKEYRRLDAFKVNRPFGRLAQYDVVVTEGGNIVDRFYYQQGTGKQFYQHRVVKDGKNTITTWMNVTVNVTEEKKEDEGETV